MAAPLMQHILASNATVYERTLASQVDQILSLDAGAIRTLWNPWTCDIELLPYLAWALSVDLWDNKWTDTKKRQAVADSFVMHKLKGTQEGIRRYLDLVDATLVRAIVPPAKTYAIGGFIDNESRLSWLNGFPQVRIYPFLTKRIPPKFRAFVDVKGYAPSTFFGAGFMQKSDGPDLLGRNAFYVKNGVSTPCSYEELKDPDGNLPQRVGITSTVQTTSFMGSTFFGKGFMQPTKAEDNVLVVRLDSNSAQRYSTDTGSTIADVQPLRVEQGRTAPIGVGFLGSAKRQRFMGMSYGPMMVYDQITILSGPLTDLRRKTKYYYGHSRFGIEPFTAELAVQIPMTRPRARFGTFMTGFMASAGWQDPAGNEPNMKKVDDALTAIGVSKSLRDTILVDTEIVRPVQLSDGMFLGSFRLGETLKIK